MAPILMALYYMAPILMAPILMALYLIEGRNPSLVQSTLSKLPAKTHNQKLIALDYWRQSV
jgi:hypothetical protein